MFALSLWGLAFLGARASAHPISLLIRILLGVLVPIVGLTGEWFLYLLGSVGIMVEATELAVRIKHVQSSAH